MSLSRRSAYAGCWFGLFSFAQILEVIAQGTERPRHSEGTV